MWQRESIMPLLKREPFALLAVPEDLRTNEEVSWRARCLTRAPRSYRPSWDDDVIKTSASGPAPPLAAWQPFLALQLMQRHSSS